MSQTQQLQQLDPEALQDFKDLHDAREEALQQKGREIGLEEGREIGLEEGQQRKAMEIAKNLLAQSIPLDVILKATGLSPDQLASLDHSKEKTTHKKK